MGKYTIFWMFENPRRGRQARSFTTNVSKILDLKSSSEQIFFRKFSLGAPEMFFGVTTDELIHLQHLKNVRKKYAIYFKLFWYKIFVHRKSKLFNVLVDSVLNPFFSLEQVRPSLQNRRFHSQITHVYISSILLLIKPT